MNIDRLIGGIFAVIMYEIPLLIMLWIIVKSCNVKLHKIRSLNGKDKRKFIAKLILYFMVFTILFLLALFVIAMGIYIAFEINILPVLPLPVVLIIMFVLITIYGCFYAFFAGLGKVVGAGGSAYGVITQLSSYLREYFEIDETKQDDNTKQ